MENLVSEELARWDEDAMNSSNSDLGTAHGRPMSGLSLRSRPSTGQSKVSHVIKWHTTADDCHQ